MCCNQSPLCRALLLLENACFACPENEARLLALAVQTGVPPLVATAGLVGWLVQQLALLARQALITGIKKVGLHLLPPPFAPASLASHSICKQAAMGGGPLREAGIPSHSGLCPLPCLCRTACGPCWLSS